jgi:hypothetical protein
MNEAQQTALDNHCRLASETIHPRFSKAFRYYSRVLTVNSGYE